ncbi:MAG: hypothetical protein V7629_09030 [Motiliproteus sp.]
MHKTRLPNTAFALCALLLCGAVLGALWSVRFLPLQDYPQHLFIAFATATADSATFDWLKHYDISPSLAPYNLCYLIIGGVSQLIGIEAAGKTFLSLIILLYTGFVLTQPKSDQSESIRAPWPLLLIFPLFFNQIFYMGFLNYLLALPLLLFALRYTISFATSTNPKSQLALLGPLMALVFLAHPYVFTVYLVLGGCILWSHWGSFNTMVRLLKLFIPSGLMFVFWYLQLPKLDQPFVFSWWDFIDGTLTYFALPFMGMRLTTNIDSITLALWAAIATVILYSLWRARDSIAWLRPSLMLWMTLLTLVLFCALPFWFGYYSYFNVRLAPLVCLLAVVTFSVLPVHRIGAAVIMVSCLGLLAIADQRHRDYSVETAAILPILEQMPANARVFPIYEDSSSAQFDPTFYYQIHAHDHHYYHTLIGGGVGPTLFPNPMLPVQYKVGALPPSPNSAQGLAQAYDFVLLRSPKPNMVNLFSEVMQPIARSGPWFSFKAIKH